MFRKPDPIFITKKCKKPNLLYSLDGSNIYLWSWNELERVYTCRRGYVLPTEAIHDSDCVNFWKT
jgi:hypothetical protein